MSETLKVSAHMIVLFLALALINGDFCFQDRFTGLEWGKGTDSQVWSGARGQIHRSGVGQGDRFTGLEWGKWTDSQVWSGARGQIHRSGVGQGDRLTGLEWGKGTDSQV